MVRHQAPEQSHRILKKHGKRALAVAREYSVEAGRFSYAISQLKGEGIDVSESGIVEKTARYMDANALRHLRAEEEAKHTDTTPQASARSRHPEAGPSTHRSGGASTPHADSNSKEPGANSERI